MYQKPKPEHSVRFEIEEEGPITNMEALIQQQIKERETIMIKPEENRENREEEKETYSTKDLFDMIQELRAEIVALKEAVFVK